MDKGCTIPKETAIPKKPCRTDYVDKIRYKRDYHNWMRKYNVKYREMCLRCVRNRMHVRYHTDPVFREKHIQYVSKRQHFLYHNDPEFRAKHDKLCRDRLKFRMDNDPEYRENRLRKEREKYHANKVLKIRK